MPTVFEVFGPATVDLITPRPAYVGNASAKFTDIMEVFVDQNARVAGLFDPTTGFIFAQFNSAAFGSYDLSTSIGGFICCASRFSGAAPTTLGDPPYHKR